LLIIILEKFQVDDRLTITYTTATIFHLASS